ncbi:MAG: hypothetical protein ACXWXF_03015, partial [Aeromicrobium sp.]
MSDDDLRSKSVPIGTRGKAGRGNAKGTPSAAARTLAGPGTRKPVVRKKDDNPAATPKPAPKKTQPAAKKKTTAKRPQKPAPHLRAVTDEEAAAVAAAAAAKRTRTASAAPMAAGIPMDEIVVALIGAAQRVLGADWEKRIAGILAGIRKRLAGD